MRNVKPLAAILVLALAAVILFTKSSDSVSVPPVEQRPNVLLIVTDDQPLHLGFAMKQSGAWLRSGTTFDRAVATTPQCCPSRSSILTGQYAHNHGVEDNFQAGDLDHETTVEYELSRSGYETAFYGKFLNKWPLENAPPYFNDYAIAQSAQVAYTGGIWNVDGSEQRVKTYGTTFISDQATAFVEGLEGDGDEVPWFIHLSYPAPHNPYIAQRRFEKARVPVWKGNPAVFEDDPSVDPGRRSDKPPWVRRFDRTFASGKERRKKQARSLMSVDRQLALLRSELEAMDEASNTLVLFVSDNGIEWAQHGLDGKMVPYVESIRVPFYAIWPGHLPKTTDDRLVGNIDIAPTILEAAGISSTVERDGRSLLDGSWSRNRILIEGWMRNNNLKYSVPPWAGFYGADLEYVEYYRNGEGEPSYREYYDMKRDPFQLRNLLGDDNRFNDPDVSALSSELQAARQCSGADECP